MKNQENFGPEQTVDGLIKGDTMMKILESGSSEEMEKLRQFYNITPETIERWREFTILRKKTHEKMDEEILQRNSKNPIPTKEEWEMGAYIEQIEPHIRKAVLELRRKGYNTKGSGFLYPSAQSIDFCEPLMLDSFVINKISEKIPAEIAELKICSDRIILNFLKFADLESMEKIWNNVVKEIPYLNHAAGLAVSGTGAIRFREKNPKYSE